MNNMILAMTWFDGIFQTDNFSLIFFIIVFTLGFLYDIMCYTVSPKRNL